MADNKQQFTENRVPQVFSHVQPRTKNTFWTG